jgi:hypothetical protein
LKLSELLSFDLASVGSAILEADDHQPQPTGVAIQLLRMKDLLSAPIDSLVQNSDEVRQILEEIKPQLPEILQLKLWPIGHLLFFWAKVEKARQRIEVRRSQAPLKANIAERCRLLNKKKAALDVKAALLHIPKDFNLWRGSWKTSRQKSGQPSSASGMRKTS